MASKRYEKFPAGIQSSKIPLATVHVAEDLNKEHEEHSYIDKINKPLNKAQIEAIQHFKGPLLTIAGAGSGKTTVLICRTGYLINEHRVHPRNILLMTFTKKAAEEMKIRLAQLPGITKSMAQMVQASTFHAFFLMLLRSRGYDQKILSNERFKQIVFKGLMKDANMEDLYEPETIIALFSSWKMNMVDINSMDKNLVRLFRKYEEWKKSHHQMDFDDILVYAHELLLSDSVLLEMLQDRFQFIMVDEFQDTNLLQYELIKMLARKHQNLMVVGDDDQTIYSFNGARGELILNFHKEFPDTKEVILNINYRSHNAIVGLGNEVIKYNERRKVKTLISTFDKEKLPQYSRPGTVDDEAKMVVEQIQKLQGEGVEYKDIAILYRAASNSRAIFETLMMEDLPFIHYSQGDQIFYDHWVVKPMVDYLRVGLNPQNLDAIEGILQTFYIKKEVGMGYISLNNSLNPKENLLLHLKDMPSLKGFQKKTIETRIQLIRQIQKRSPDSAIKFMRKEFYDKYLQNDEGAKMTIDKEMMKEMLDELETSAKRFETTAEFLNFIDEMKLKQQEFRNGINGNENKIQLMTIHKAKGLEFPVVFVIGASEGILPHVTALEAGKVEIASPKEKAKYISDAIEEERRLMYVAITRAKEELFISSPSFYRGKEAKVSRFLLEAFGKVVQDKQKATFSVPPVKNVSESEGATTKIKVSAWVCTSDNCHAWQRIRTTEEENEKNKECPLCKSEMMQGEKEVMVG